MTRLPSVLFDVQSDDPKILDVPSVPYSVPKLYKILLQFYMGSLFFQYLTIFACVPFDYISNRPSILIIGSLYCILMFSACAVVSPIYFSKDVTRTTFNCLFMSCILELIGLLLNITSVVISLNVDNMYMFEYDGNIREDRKVNVTIYLQISYLLALIFSTISFFLCVVNMFIVRGILNFATGRLRIIPLEHRCNPPKYESLYENIN